MSAQRVLARSGAFSKLPTSSFRSPLHQLSPFLTRSQARLWHTAAPFRIHGRNPTWRLSRVVRRHASDKPLPDVTSQLGSPEAKLGLQARLKKLFKQYGYLSVGVYLVLSALDFPLCFLAVRLAGPERIGQIEHQILTTLKRWTAPVWDVIQPVVGPIVDQVRGVTEQMRQGAVNTAGMGPGEEGTTGDVQKAEIASKSIPRDKETVLTPLQVYGHSLLWLTVYTRPCSSSFVFLSQLFSRRESPGRYENGAGGSANLLVEATCTT